MPSGSVPVLCVGRAGGDPPPPLPLLWLQQGTHRKCRGSAIIDPCKVPVLFLFTCEKER